MPLSYTNGSEDACVRRPRKMKSHAFLSSDQNEPFTLLRNSEMGGIEYSPVNVVTEIRETTLYLFNNHAFLVGRKSNYIFHHEYSRSKVVDVSCELFE